MEEGFPKWGIIGGALAAAAWAVAATWEGPFKPLTFFGAVLAVALFGFLAFAAGFVPASLAKAEKDWFKRIEYILLGLAINGGLIWYIFFR
jgi:hypothetical protein